MLARHAGRAPVRPYFLHLRRGDYLGNDLWLRICCCLPSSFAGPSRVPFTRGFDLLVLVTDDPHWARTEFADLGDVVVLSEDPALISPSWPSARAASCRTVRFR